MGKNASAILGIIGILLGAGGLLFGLISWMSASPNQRSWYDYVGYDVIGSSGETIDGLSLTMNLNSGETLYVSFTYQFDLDDTSGELKIFIDGLNTNGRTRVSRDTVAGWESFSISLQHINNTLTAGAHIITVWAIGSDPSNYAKYCTLFVQTL